MAFWPWEEYLKEFRFLQAVQERLIVQAGILPRISVRGPKERVPEGVLRLCVGSWSPIANPSGWRDLWKLSPLCATPEGVAVPGLSGERSKTVENAWQFLKIWPVLGCWLEEEARAAFASDVAIRYRITEKGVTGVAPSAWEGFQERVARLYEQNAPLEDIRRRIEQYVRRWKRWAWSGVRGVSNGALVWTVVGPGLSAFGSGSRLRAEPAE